MATDLPLIIYGSVILTFLILNLRLHVFDGIARLHLESNRLPGKRFHEDLHCCQTGFRAIYLMPLELVLLVYAPRKVFFQAQGSVVNDASGPREESATHKIEYIIGCKSCQKEAQTS